MLAFTSWSYMHDLSPIKEVITIDPERNVPVHETMTSHWQQKVFEIDFADYVEVEPGQWAPRSIRIEAKDTFTCEYQFQLVAGKHWMLKEVVSWFKPENKSRGVVEDVRINGDRELLDDALRQVSAARALFGGAGDIDHKVDVLAVPFVLGRAMRIGPYEVRVTMRDERTVSVSASTNDPSAAASFAAVFPRRAAQATIRADDLAQGAGWRPAGLGGDSGLACRGGMSDPWRCQPKTPMRPDCR